MDDLYTSLGTSMMFLESGLVGDVLWFFGSFTLTVRT